MNKKSRDSSRRNPDFSVWELFGRIAPASRKRNRFSAASHNRRLSCLSVNLTADHTAVFPFCGYRETAACPETGERSVRPCIGKCGKNVDTSVVALEKHFRDARRAAEVSVNLERRMCIPEIRQCTQPEQVAVEAVCAVAVTGSCPCVETVCQRLAGRLIGAQIECHLGGIQPCRSFASDGGTGIQTDEL